MNLSCLNDPMILLLDYETIILELTPERVKTESQRGKTIDFNAESRKVLLAEDSSSIRSMLGLELEEHGFQVILARDGNEALQMVDLHPDLSLIISDVEMPHTDGLAFTKRIKENPQTEHIPVIVYSSIGDIGMKERARFLRAEEHITKLNMTELFNKISEILTPALVG